MTGRWRQPDVMRLWRVTGWLGVMLALGLSLMPPVLNEGGNHTDKIVHLLGYAMLTFWWAQLVTHQRWKLVVAVVLFGIGVELLQGLTPDRLPDPLDALANTLGALLGWLAAHCLPNLPDRLMHTAHRKTR
jgi:VanZ family protein